jgi:hypothetical protein
MSWAEVKYLQDNAGTGIPPQKPDFKAVPGDKKVTVKWTIPESTTIEGQEVCRAKGIIVRRKTDGYPTDENDGTLIVSTDQISGSVVDSDVTNKTTYYYRAFSYSDHNIINRDPAAESKATPDEVESCEVTVAASDGAKSLGDDVITRVTLTNETKGTTETADLSGGVGSTTFSIQGGEVYHISTQLIQADTEVDYVTGTDAVYAITNATSESYTAVLGNVREVAMPITALPKTESFSADSWDTIKQYSENGLASKIYGVGDEKTVSINGTNYAVAIMDFDHDDLTDGSGKAGITIGLKNCLTTTRAMNSSDSNSGGWESCAMRSWLQSTVLGWLPEELQAVIKKVNKKATAGSKSTTIKTSEDNLFLLAEVEVFGSKTYGSLDEGTQYSYFTTTSRRVKKSGDSGSSTYWWERSPYTSSSSYFCGVDSSGSANYSGASYAYGVSFSFCI